MTVVSNVPRPSAKNWDLPVCHYKKAQREISRRLINSRESLLGERAAESSQCELFDAEGRSLGVCRPSAQLEQIAKEGASQQEDACTRLYLDYFRR